MSVVAWRAILSAGALTLLLFAAPSARLQNPPTAPRFIHAAGAGASLVDQGLALPAPTGADAAAFEPVPAPGVRNVRNETYAQATISPWVDSNAWRFQRGARKVSYTTLPPGSAPLAAAEAFAFAVEAIVSPDPADVPELRSVMRFLQASDRPSLPPLANVGIVDDGSPAMAEVLNMLTRRNLLYRIVPQPDRRLDLNVQLGTPAFPLASTTNPSDFAARVREQLGDDKRFVRLYGTSTAIARLTGDATRIRLFLLSYSRNRLQQDVRVRLLGRYTGVTLAAYSAPGSGPEPTLADVTTPGNATEFTIPSFSTIAIVDAAAIR